MMVSNQIKLLLLGCESLQCALRVQPREWWAARKQTGEHGDDFEDGDDEGDDIHDDDGDGDGGLQGSQQLMMFFCDDDNDNCRCR